MAATEKMYHLGPIDWWNGWMTEREYMEQLLQDGDAHAAAALLADYLALHRRAERMALQAGWEGDVRDGPFVAALPPADPNGHLCPVMIAWKQDNNGETFAYSPYPLPWMEKA